MYGMGGGFGGMPYVSPGSAIVKGIEAGAGFMQRSQQELDRRDQMQLERSRADRQEAASNAHIAFMERNETDKEHKEAWTQAWQVHQQQAKDLETQLTGIEGRHMVVQPDGSYAPDEKALMADPEYAAWSTNKQAYNKAHSSLMEAAYRPFVVQGQDQAAQTTKQLAAGTIDPTDPQFAEKLAHWNSVMYGDDPAKMLSGSNGEPSQFANAVSDFHQGFQQGNPEMISSGLQGLYGTHAEQGRLGYMDNLGGTITSATFNPTTPFVPSRDGQSVIPVLSTTGQRSDGSVTTQPYAAPTVGGYDHEENQDLVHIDPSKMMDMTGKLGAIHSVMQHPAIQANLRDYLQNPSQDVLDYAQARTALPGNTRNTTKIVQRGGRSFAQVVTPDGRQIAEHEMPGTFAPTNQFEAQYGALKDQYGIGTPQADTAGFNKAVLGMGGGTEKTPQDEREAKAIVESGATNPTTGQPYRSIGEVYAAKMHGIGGGKPNEAEAKSQGELSATDAEQSFGAIPDPSGLTKNHVWMTDSPAGTAEGQGHKAGDPLSPADEGKLAVKVQQARKGAHNAAYGGGGVHEAPGSADSVGTQYPTREKQLDWMNKFRAKNPKATEDEVVQFARIRGVLPPGAVFQPNPAPLATAAPTKPKAPPPGKGINLPAPVARSTGPGQLSEEWRRKIENQNPLVALGIESPPAD